MPSMIFDYSKLFNLFGAFQELKVSPESLISASADIEQKITQLNDRFSEVSEKVNNTSSYWLGGTADEYRKNFSEDIELTKGIIDSLGVYVEKLKHISGNYTEAETQNSDSAGALPIDVIV